MARSPALGAQVERTTTAEHALKPQSDSGANRDFERWRSVESVQELRASLDQLVHSELDVDRIVVELAAPPTHEAFSVLPRVDGAAQRTQL